MSLRRSAGVFIGGVIMAVVAAGCGGSGDDGATGTANPSGDGVDQVIEVEARDTQFFPNEITVQAGQTVKLVLSNKDAGTDHDLQAEGMMVRRIEGGAGAQQGGGHGGGDMLAIHTAEGGTSSIVFVADTPGTYEIFCTVDRHREAGMVGVIKVV
jgi:plastocyanin